MDKIIKYELVTSLASGLIFGFGLCFSQMINPARVLGFLDISGNWDATLLFVMAGALTLTVPFYRLILKRERPVCAKNFINPVKTKIDVKLIIGAILFGVGWGLAGFCPGPALTTLISGNTSVLIFVTAMFAGFVCNKWLFE